VRQLKIKKLVIETNGTSMGTRIFADDIQLGRIKTLSFNSDIDQIPINVTMMETRTNTIDPNIPIGEIKSEPLIIEFIP
jgi:hypothetical protein